MTDGALLNCDTVLGEALLSKLLDALYPSAAKRTLDNPTRALESAEDLAEAFEGERSLDGRDVGEKGRKQFGRSERAVLAALDSRKPRGPAVVPLL